MGLQLTVRTSAAQPAPLASLIVLTDPSATTQFAEIPHRAMLTEFRATALATRALPLTMLCTEANTTSAAAVCALPTTTFARVCTTHFAARLPIAMLAPFMFQVRCRTIPMTRHGRRRWDIYSGQHHGYGCISSRSPLTCLQTHASHDLTQAAQPPA